MIALKRYLPLLKLRIGVMVAFSAVVAYVATAEEGIRFSTAAILALTTLMASASSGALNHYFDRDIDGMMERTKNRPLVTGNIRTPGDVLWLAIPLLLASLFISATVLNPLVALHLFLGAVVYVAVYTVWLKRRSWTNIVFGGLSGSFAVLAGGASARPEFCLLPLLLAVVMFFWTPSHFWSLAMLHREEYRKAGIPMLPVVIGNQKTAFSILLNTLFLVAASLLPFFWGSMGGIYLVGAVATGLFFIARNLQLIVNPSNDMAWKNFKASMIYLGTLLIAVLLDVGF